MVWQTLNNDIWNVIFPSHATSFGTGHLKPTFRLDEQGRLIWPAKQIGEIFCDLYLECIYRIQRYGSIDDYWERYLPSPAQPVTANSAPRLPIVETDQSVDKEKSPWAIFLEPPSKRELYGIALARALYQEMKEESARHNAKFLVLDVNRYTNEGLAELKNFPFYSLGQKLVKHNDKLYLAGGREAYFARSGALNVGLDFVMVDMDRPHYMVSETDPHLNEAGNSRVMEQVAANLVDRGWVK